MAQTTPVTTYFNFNTSLNIKGFRQCFKDFLKTLHSEEQIEFLDNVELLKNLKKEERNQQESIAMQLLKTYVQTGSMKEINVDQSMRENCERVFKEIQQESAEEQRHYYCAFKELESQIVFQLRQDMFDSFLLSSQFEIFLCKTLLDKYPSLKDHNHDSNGYTGPNNKQKLLLGKLNIPASLADISSAEDSSILASSDQSTSLSSKVRKLKPSRLFKSTSPRESTNNMELLHQKIRSLTEELEEKEKEITVLKRQLMENNLVPRGLEYYHTTSAFDRNIKPINPKLLPLPTLLVNNVMITPQKNSDKEQSEIVTENSAVSTGGTPVDIEKTSESTDPDPGISVPSVSASIASSADVSKKFIPRARSRSAILIRHPLSN